MKNTRLKNVIFTAGMAVFTGVLLLGVNAAIGAATPTVDPPGAGVSPTFTGLNVTGNIQNNSGNNGGGIIVDDDMTVDGNVYTNEITAKGIELTEWFLSNGGGWFSSLNVGGTLGAGSIHGLDDTGAATDLTVENGLKVTGQLEVNSPIVHGTPGEFVTVNGPFEATDLVNIGNNVMIENNSDITVTGDADIQGAIKNSATSSSPLAAIVGLPVWIEDNLLVTGSIVASGKSITGGTYWEPIVMTATQIVPLLRVAYGSTGTANTGEIWIQDDIIDTPTQGGPVLELTPTEINNRKGSIRLQKWNDEDVIIGADASTTSDLTINGDVFAEDDLTVNDTLTVTGAAKASRFGTYTRRGSSLVVVSSQLADGVNDFEHIEVTKACNNGETLVSCGGYASGSSSGYNWTRWITFDRIDSFNDTCYVGGTNTNPAANEPRYIKAVAICLDPDL